MSEFADYVANEPSQGNLHRKHRSVWKLYPGEVRDEHAIGSLEHFLNSILVQNPNNQLVFANLVQVQGFQGMDFFIRTNDVYFKGRVLLAKNYLYLLAMECEKHNYQDEHYQFFIESFELVK